MRAVLLIPFAMCINGLGCADEYRLDPEPLYTQGTAHTKTPFSPPTDPKVCGVYLQNLRYFARRDAPMSCKRPIAPSFKNQIQEAAWEDLDPRAYPVLFKALVARHNFL